MRTFGWWDQIRSSLPSVHFLHLWAWSGVGFGIYAVYVAPWWIGVPLIVASVAGVRIFGSRLDELKMIGRIERKRLEIREARAAGRGEEA